MKDIIKSLRAQLRAHTDEKAQASGQRFFKEPVNLYGIKTAVVNSISKEYFTSLKGLSKDEIFDLCEELWKSGNIEESVVACNWSYALRKNFQPGDFFRFRKCIDSYVNNWASCDTLCNHTVGYFLEKYPQFIEELKKCTQSENRWMKRASAVSLIIPVRHGMFFNDVFEIADLLLTDSDDMVQKGYGWLLKVASQQNQQPVLDYVMKHKAIMPRTALRYAIEKMPKEMRAQAMSK